MSLKGKLSALRFGRGGRQHVYTSAGVILAAVAVVSVLTWLNDAHKPLVRSIEEAVESSLPEALEQVDEQVATLLGIDEETVRTAREGLAGLVAPRPERLIEIATGRPVSTNSTTPASAPSPAPDSAAPVSGEPSPTATDVPPSPASEPSSPQGTSEPPPATDTPPATSEPTLPPATDTPPPATEEPSPPPEEPSPPAEEPSPPVAEEPPATGEPALPKEEPSPPTKGEQLPATKTSPVPTEGTGG
jgi:hypothetical protein